MPLESMYFTPARFNRIFWLPPATRPLIAPRNAVALSPMRTSPLKSRTATSPACLWVMSNSAIAETSVSVTSENYHRPQSLEVAERLCFTVISVKDRQQFGDRKQVLQLLRQAQQFELPALFINRRIAR